MSVVSKHLCSQFDLFEVGEQGTRRRDFSGSAPRFFIHRPQGDTFEIPSPFSLFLSPNLVTAFCAPAGYFPAEGYRHDASGVVTRASTYGHRWMAAGHASTPTHAFAFRILSTVGGVEPSGAHYRVTAFSVRCLQAFTLVFDLFEVEGTRRREKGEGISAVALRAFLSIAHRAIPLKSLLLSPCSFLPFFSDC